MPRIAPALVGMLLCVASGCGTAANLQGLTVASLGGPFPCPTRPFGGVIQDCAVTTGLPCGFLLAPDLPFSFLADVVTLPWAIAWSGKEGPPAGPRPRATAFEEPKATVPSPGEGGQR